MESLNPTNESNEEITVPVEEESTEPEIKGKTVTTAEAAKIIGCSPQQVRTLVRKKKILATRVPSARNPAGYDLLISQASAKAYGKRIYPRGWPRGVPRNLGSGE